MKEQLVEGLRSGKDKILRVDTTRYPTSVDFTDPHQVMMKTRQTSFDFPEGRYVVQRTRDRSDRAYYLGSERIVVYDLVEDRFGEQVMRPDVDTEKWTTAPEFYRITPERGLNFLEGLASLPVSHESQREVIQATVLAGKRHLSALIGEISGQIVTEADRTQVDVWKDRLRHLPNTFPAGVEDE